MFKKCKANCQANDNLYLRGDVFYYMVELPRQDGKRRYFIKSLHTKNYYEALEKAKNMKKAVELHTMDTKKLLKRAKELMDRVVFDTVDVNIDNGDGRIITTQQKRISAKTDIKVVEELWDIVSNLYQPHTNRTLDDDDLKLIAEIVNMRVDAGNEKLMEMLQSKLNYTPTDNPPSANETIGDILTKWLSCLETINCETEAKRKHNIVDKMVRWVGLDPESYKYVDFYRVDVIDKICKKIKDMTDSKGNTKRKYARYLRDFTEYAPSVNPVFQTNLTPTINLFLKSLDKTSSLDIKGHMQYTREHLIQIFDPKQTFFKDNEDQFWFVVISLFTGARRNAATTLQYGDIINKDGIDCIQFKRNHKIKQLKNDESERLVPIAKQLLDLGFVEYVKRRKTKLKAKDTDFIFPNCQRPKDDGFNTNIVQKGFLQYVKDLGIKQPGGEQYDFHSLRNNAAEILQKAGVDIIFINKIIGWKGQNTMLAHYSKRVLADIKTEVDKLRYDFLQPEFDYWRDVMSKK